MNELNKYNEKTFDDIKHIDENGREYWYARELQKVLEYKDWRNFEKVINKAIISAKNSFDLNQDWVVEVNRPIKISKGKIELIRDFLLSRYVCYLIVQNANPNKEVVALGQTYFAIQTRKQELNEMEYSLLTEEEKRLFQRSLTKKGNYSLNQTAKNVCVNAGYKGLYNGETANDIFKRKGLRYRENILDNMGSEELAANLFRITQTESKLKRDNIEGENNANLTHYKMSKDIRKFIEDQGGTMPEDLLTPVKSLKQIEKERKMNLLKNK